MHIADCRVVHHEWGSGRAGSPGRTWYRRRRLEEGHRLLRADLEALSDDALDEPRSTNWGEQWPAWRILWVMIDHDAHDQRTDLDRQVARLSAWAAGQGIGVAEVVCEVGSGLTGRRPRLWRLLADPGVTMIVVEHRGRLARFGWGR